ncbi:hypothetical protein [Haliangium sp. UPWRP_2]|uniref:hypothetical protein n=1 Tax=Haliangium sp. UPWRP_2 TaxID=1931276 RepID=UPI0011B244FC|nr:hypothetical protein [Haliangium sp. UPWRP_2]
MDLANCQDQMSARFKKALADLTNHVNLSTGLHHDADLEHGIDLFDKLYDAGEYPHPDAVGSELRRLGWSDEHSRHAAGAWEVIATLRDFQTRKIPRPLARIP